MKPVALRLLLCTALFVGWLGYLAYLVFTLPKTPSGRPLMVSRPQLLVSELDVVARVGEGETDEVTVEKILYPSEGAPVKVGDRIPVTNLNACRPSPMGVEESPPDLAGPGSYLIPLRRVGGHYEVVAIPESPGYIPPSPFRAGPRIYPANPEVLAQYGQAPKKGMRDEG